MKNSKRVSRAGVLFLLLLVSHETITVASNIRTAKNMRGTGDMLFAMESVNEMLEHLDESALESMLLEVDSKGGMSEAEAATHEVRIAHESIREGYAFENSPVLGDLDKLPAAPGEGEVLSAAQLQYHRGEISSFLEKAFSHLGARSHHQKGECERSAKVSWFDSCSEESDCVSSKAKPCAGKCVCDKSGVNECECVSDSDVDLGDVLKNRKVIDEAFRMKDFFKYAAYGFVDGFFSGMIHHIHEGFEDPKCHDHSYVSESADDLLESLSEFWDHVKSIHTKIWSKTDRKEVLDSFVTLLKRLKHMLSSAMTFVWKCTGTRQLTLLFGIILVFFGLQLAIMGTTFFPILIKVGGMLLGLYYTGSYVLKASKYIVKNVQKKIDGKCGHDCNKKLVKSSFGILGAFAELVMLSGAGSMIKKLAKPGAVGNIKVLPTIRVDMRILMNKVRLSKSGKAVRVTQKTFKSKPKAVADKRLKAAMAHAEHSGHSNVLHALHHGAHAGEKFAHGPVTNALGHHEGGGHHGEGHEEKHGEGDGKAAEGPHCKHHKGVCIDTQENICTVQTVRGKCPGAAHIHCCPSSRVKVESSEDEHEDGEAHHRL